MQEVTALAHCAEQMTVPGERSRLRCGKPRWRIALDQEGSHMSKKPFALCQSTLVLSLLLAGCAADVESIGSAEQATHAWGSYHWARTSNPFTLALGNNVSSAWSSYLSGASNDWSQSAVLDTVVVAGEGGKRCRPTGGRVEVCNGAYGTNGWLGLATIWLAGAHIVQGTVKLNDTYYKSASYDTPAWRASVMCQEIGHTFGLAHNDEDFSTTTGTCMDYSNNPELNQHPDQHDYEQLEIIYAHLDSTTTVGTAEELPPALASADFSAMEEWGDPVDASPGDRVHTFVRDLGNFQVVTTVTWAPE
jgi:hypothetical protein